MRRSATVLQAERVTVPASDSQEAWQVLTDFPRQDERAFYLRLDFPRPEVGSSIIYGNDHAWYVVGGQQITARKVGMNFDPEAPLR